MGRNENCTWLCITGISPLRGSLRAAPGGTGVPTLMLSSQDRPATACFMDGWTRSPPYCRIGAVSCTGGSLRSLQSRCPFSVFTRHTNGCISASGYSVFKLQRRGNKTTPHYLGGFGHTFRTENQKLPKTFIKDFSFDKILSRRLSTPLGLMPILLA